MARAGYDPNAAVNVWKKMMAAEKGSPPEFLSTHPAPGNRIAELQAMVPRVLPLYQTAKR
jgi:predicted Zn-dependent protease